MERGFGHFTLVLAAVACVCLATLAAGQKVAGYDSLQENRQAVALSTSNMIIPASSVARPEDAGKFAHTNYVLRTLDGVNPHMSVSPDLTETETPASLGCIYKVGPNYTGCNPATGAKKHPSGGWGAIAIVDAYHNPYAAYELKTFSAAYGLPFTASKFTQVYANGNGHCTVPPVDPGWGLEISLDIEWAHVMAPAARIILVEACSSSMDDLAYAEYVAGQWVAKYGGGDISNSWGGGEFSGELAYDNYFFRYYFQNISYFASAGDSGCSAAYPSSSPWVVSAGGTTVNRDSSGNFVNESCWAGSGGGTSTYEVWEDDFNNSGMGGWASYQYPIFGQGARHTPDISFNADPASGAVVFDCAYFNGSCYYFAVGGTSLSAPALAGIVNSAANKMGTANLSSQYAPWYTNQENNLIYAEYLAIKEYAKNYYDVTTGSNGCTVGAGWDYCTGVGSPRGKLGK